MIKINEKMKNLGQVRSVIREIFEYGKKRSAEIGAENVFDFSLGNPNVPPPAELEECIAELSRSSDPSSLHGYTSAQGDARVREAVAQGLADRFGAKIDADGIYMTCGAAASLSISLRAIVSSEDDEVIVFAPFFPEYRVFVENTGAKLVAVDADEESFGINFDKLEELISPKTKAVIVNSPNNPSGAVLSEDCILRLSRILEEKSAQLESPIFLISDEPYRELVYGDVKLPYIPNYYKYTLLCYSYSKSLSLPGERIGYIAVSSDMPQCRDVYAAICGAGRSLGYVCAPSLMQKVIALCGNMTSDISVYRENRDLLYSALCEYGFDCVHPDGAFYLFVKAPGADAEKFCEMARKYELLLVPSDSFGCPGYARISYCVKTETVLRALPYFKKLAVDCGL
jgi:aspartate aminotransferase